MSQYTLTSFKKLNVNFLPNYIIIISPDIYPYHKVIVLGTLKWVTEYK